MKPILLFDIETCADPTTSHQRTEFIDRKEGNQDRVSFLPEFNQIITIAVGRIKDDGQIEVKTIEGNEKEMIEKFYTYTEKYILCGYNILMFDIPFIVKRWLKYWLKVPLWMRIANEKPWTLSDKFIDLGRIYQATTFNMSAMEDVAMHLGIPTPKDIMHGKDVQKFYDEWRLDLIQKYCKQDVECTGLIYQKLTDLNFI